jgi:hypothetical protein
MKNITVVADSKHQILNSKLKGFGLNPREWQISEVFNGIIIIQNIFENEMTLLGRATFNQHTWDWENIQFVEI